MRLSDALKILRVELGLTQRELASDLQVSFATISRWEKGKTFPNETVRDSILKYAGQQAISNDCLKALQEAITNSKKTEIGDYITQLRSCEKSPLVQLVDADDTPIYICDYKTYDLLYLNAKAEAYLGTNSNTIRAAKCYKFLMHRETPCPFCNKNKLERGRYIGVDTYRPEDNSYHRIKGKIIDWNGRKAQVRQIIDVSPLLDVNTQNVRALAYDQQLKVRKDLATDALVIARLNISQNTILCFEYKHEYFKKALISGQVDVVLAAIKSNCSTPTEKLQLEMICSRDCLIQQFYNGKTQISIKHYMQDLKGYYEEKIALMQNPLTFDIEAYLVLKDVTEETIVKEVASKLLTLEYESIITIDVAAKEAKIFHTQPQINSKTLQRLLKDNGRGYNEFLRKYCLEEDVEKIISKISLPYVIKQLAKKTSYALAYYLKRKDKIVQNRTIFTYLDQNKHTILVATQDLSELLDIERVKLNQIKVAVDINKNKVA